MSSKICLNMFGGDVLLESDYRMSRPDSILRAYVLFRRQGLASLASLEQLRPQIEPLNPKQKGRVVAGMRYYEKHVAHKYKQPQPASHAVNVPYGDPNQQPVLCPQCSTLNWNGETHCHRCQATLDSTSQPTTAQVAPNGQSNGNGTGTHSRMLTRRLDSGDVPRDDEFTPASTLILRLPQHHDMLELTPQKYDRSLIFGRFDETGGIIPDVDFTDYSGAEYGVSRLHMALTYEPRYNRLVIKDMGSVNGVVVNGQTLNAYESRTLHQGDRLELGRMIIQVLYVHN